MKDPEIAAMAAVLDALSSLPDEESQGRVLRWAFEKFGGAISGAALARTASLGMKEMHSLPQDNEIPGIARLTDAGDFRVTVRDLKAKSANDAAVRLAHIAIRAYARLTGQQTVSSKGVLVPLLKLWRIYDGNTRTILAKQKGIIRSGDLLELDVHAQVEADRFIAEVLDTSVEGSWTPSNVRRKTRSEPMRRDDATRPGGEP